MSSSLARLLFFKNFSNFCGVHLSEFKVDVSYFRMIAEYYARKCPCWGGRYFCPCLPFVETKNCKCGAVRTLNDPKGQKPAYKTYRINFDVLADVVNNGYKCPLDSEKSCFCKEFLESGKCALNIFEQIG